MKRLMPLLLCLAAGFVPAVQAQDEAFPLLQGTLHETEEDPGTYDWSQHALEVGALGSHTNAVRCHRPSGEREYLDRLRCSNGEAPGYARIGSFGEGPDEHVIDGYDVICPDYRVTVFMDMYHEEEYETAPVGAFRIGLAD